MPNLGFSYPVLTVYHRIPPHPIEVIPRRHFVRIEDSQDSLLSRVRRAYRDQLLGETFLNRIMLASLIPLRIIMCDPLPNALREILNNS